MLDCDEKSAASLSNAAHSLNWDQPVPYISKIDIFGEVEIRFNATMVPAWAFTDKELQGETHSRFL